MTFKIFCGKDGCKSGPVALGQGSSGKSLGLTAPVGDGQRCRNVDADVRKVQTALNRFTDIEGGPTAPLEVDGRYGKFSRAALWKFQRKHIGPNLADGVVDPGKSTDRELSAAASTYGSLTAEMEKHRIHASALVGIARAALTSARMYKSASINFTGLGESNWKTLCFHFQVDKFPGPNGWSDAMDWIDKMYVNIQTAIGHIPQGLQLLQDEPASSNEAAYAFAYMGGYELARRNNDTGKDGVRMGSIYLCPRMQQLDQESFAYVLIHEAAHYAGPSDARQGIDDYGYRHSKEHRYDRMLPWQRTHNADCYSQFAFAVAGRPFDLEAHKL